jgi:hypothetical protein
MTHLHQVIAKTKGATTRAATGLGTANGMLTKPQLMVGRARTYKPVKDGDTVYPAENQRVQLRGTDIIAQLREMTELLDVTLTKDVTNTAATATLIVGNDTLGTGVPVTYLLWLEKRLDELKRVIDRLPVLDPATEWEFDDNNNVWRAGAVETIRTRKVPKNHVMAEATDKHPAQVHMYTEDVAEGTWTTVEMSGALPQTRVDQLQARVGALIDAVRVAREQANATEVVTARIGENIFDYLFAA